jgi:hypothetical protein
MIAESIAGLRFNAVHPLYAAMTVLLFKPLQLGNDRREARPLHREQL